MVALGLGGAVSLKALRRNQCRLKPWISSSLCASSSWRVLTKLVLAVTWTLRLLMMVDSSRSGASSWATMAVTFVLALVRSAEVLVRTDVVLVRVTLALSRVAFALVVAASTWA